MKLQRQAQELGRKPALIVVDVACGFTDPVSPLGIECSAVVEVNRQLVSAFRAQSLPIVFTTVAYSEPDQARVFRSRLPSLNVLEKGSRWTQIDPRLKLLPDDLVLEKHWASAFFATALQSWLRGAAVDSLVVTGLSTSGCVRATAVDGLQHDYPVFVPRDAVADRDPAAHEANLCDLHAKYAEVLDSIDVIEGLGLNLDFD